jgi:hypothetical protein
MLRESPNRCNKGEDLSCVIHYPESYLSHFYARWTANPDSISDGEFFLVQMHLLACADCCRVGKQCEDRERSRAPSVAA